MAAYTFLAAEPTLKVYSAELTQDAQRITASAVQSGVVFSLVFAPYPFGPDGAVVWTSEAIAGQLAYWAGIWDSNSEEPGVIGIGLAQETNALGQLDDVAIVAVSSTSGKSTTQLELGPRSFLPSVAGTTLTQSFPDAVAAARAQLDADEAGGG